MSFRISSCLCTILLLGAGILASSTSLLAEQVKSGGASRGQVGAPASMCQPVDDLIALDSAHLSIAMTDTATFAQNIANGRAPVEGLSGAFVMAMTGNKITARACRETCMASGGDANLCRLVCSQLKNGTCCGLWALMEHMLRHRQKKAAETALLIYNAMCSSGGRN